jgi:hypothetical protein
VHQLNGILLEKLLRIIKVNQKLAQIIKLEVNLKNIPHQLKIEQHQVHIVYPERLIHQKAQELHQVEVHQAKVTQGALEHQQEVQVEEEDNFSF